MVDFTCYRVRNRIDGMEVTTFDDCVNLDNAQVIEYATHDYTGFSAKLYVSFAGTHPPHWTPFILSGGFRDAEIPNVASASALLLVALDEPPQFFAFTYGHGGRFLLRPGAVERNYGLKTALNLIYPVEANLTDGTRVRSVDTKRIADTTLRTRRQTARTVIFEGFDVDRLRDILRSLTGTPVDVETWGPNVTGGDALKFTASVKFQELGRLCRRVELVARKQDYQQTFPWVDHMRSVQDPDELQRVQQAVIDTLQAGDPGEVFELSPPELLDWRIVSSFQYHFDRRQRQQVTRPNFDLAYYLMNVKREEITCEWLKSRHLFAFDGDGRQVGKWSIWRCLTGTVQLDGSHYVLDDGDLYEVAGTFLEGLNNEIDAIPQSTLEFPDCNARYEDQYTKQVSETMPDYLLLDTKLVRGPGYTTGVEVCDLLPLSPHLIYVKRHFVSKTLSHLFSQGLVVADCLRRQDFREAVTQKVLQEGGDVHRLLFDDFKTREWEVVYAIIGRWRGRQAAQALPFFSKITLRHVNQEISSFVTPLPSVKLTLFHD